MIIRLVFSSLLVVVCLGVVGIGTRAAAQSITPPPGATYGQPLPVPPARPLYYSPFNNYDLLYGYSRGALTAPQPIGHEHIPLGPNGYIYRPVYAAPPQAPGITPPPVIPQALPAQAVPANRPLANRPLVSRPLAGRLIPRRLTDAPPPAPESVVKPEQVKPAGPREF